LDRAVRKNVLGVEEKVASLADLVEGKLRAWSDPETRLSKRSKDQTDLFRIAESYPETIALFPEKLKKEISEDLRVRVHRIRQGPSRAKSGERELPGPRR
jgi:hypothetical protein